MMNKLIIKNESQAWQAMEDALNNKLDDNISLEFDGWPVLNLRIEGEDFNNTIPTRVMSPIMDFQKEIHRIYCKAKYNSEDTRKLKPHERDLLELIVKIEPGSTKFIADIFKALNEIIQNTNMTGKQAVVLIIGVGAILGSVVSWKSWVVSNERKHSQEISVRMSEQETQRLEIFAQAMIQQPELKQSEKFTSDFRSELSKRLKPEDKLSVSNMPIITGERAAEIVPNLRQSGEATRIDGEFHITEVKFPISFGGNYRLSVVDLNDSRTFQVIATPSSLSTEQIEALKTGGFDVKKVKMEINARQLRGRISNAQLVSARILNVN